MAHDPNSILLAVLTEYADDDKWANQKFEHVRRIPSTKVGDVGQDFVERLCSAVGLSCEFPLNSDGSRKRQSPWDIRIEGATCELKTASEDANGAFQFNHIRYSRKYDALLCVGIGPANIYVAAWSKAEVATGKAGNLTSMEKGGSVSHKLTKKPSQMSQIEDFEKVVRALAKKLNDKS